MNKEVFYSILVVSVCLISKITSQKYDGFIEQRMIDGEGKVIPYKYNLRNGEYCINSVECLSGCCLRGKKGRQCTPKSSKGEKCTNIVAKGEIYMNHCPCSSGSDACSRSNYGHVGVCTS